MATPQAIVSGPAGSASGCSLSAPSKRRRHTNKYSKLSVAKQGLYSQPACRCVHSPVSLAGVGAPSARTDGAGHITPTKVTSFPVMSLTVFNGALCKCLHCVGMWALCDMRGRRCLCVALPSPVETVPDLGPQVLGLSHLAIGPNVKNRSPVAAIFVSAFKRKIRSAASAPGPRRDPPMRSAPRAARANSEPGCRRLQRRPWPRLTHG